jgi:hypothetical protein
LDHDLSDDECWAILIAVHDARRVPKERIGPADNILFKKLRRIARALDARYVRDLRAILSQACASLAPAAPLAPDSKAPPPTPELEAQVQAASPQQREQQAVQAMVLPAMMSARELASYFGLPYSKLESALRRYRAHHLDCWHEVENPRRNEPRIMYRVAEVSPVVQRLKKAG